LADGLDLAHLPHPRRDPSGARLPATGESFDLPSRFLGPHFLQPPPLPGAHGGQRAGLAILCYGARAAPAMETTALFTWYRPLAAEAVPVPHTGATALLVFSVGAWFCHRRDLSMQLAFLILHLGA
jgi:hypothetical protein